MKTFYQLLETIENQIKFEIKNDLSINDFNESFFMLKLKPLIQKNSIRFALYSYFYNDISLNYVNSYQYVDDHILKKSLSIIKEKTKEIEIIINKFIENQIIESINNKIFNQGFEIFYDYDIYNNYDHSDKYYFDQIIINMDILKDNKNYGDYQYITGLKEINIGGIIIQKIYAKPQEGIDWRPNEITPEDYYAL